MEVKRYQVVSGLFGMFAVWGMLVPAAFAADQDSSKGDKSKSNQAGGGADSRGKTEIPSFLTDLQLKQDQQDRIKSILQKYDPQIEQTWTRLQESLTESIGMEATLLAAIEDGLTEMQRKHVRKRRQKTIDSSSDQGTGSKDQSDATSGDTRNKTANANADNGPKGPRTSAPPANSNKGDAGNANANANGNNGNAEPVDELVVIGITLTPEQQTRAGRVHSSYDKRLHALRAETHAMHWKLVALEAEKMTSIEEVLTKDQLQKLRQGREHGPDDSDSSGDEEGAPAPSREANKKPLSKTPTEK